MLWDNLRKIEILQKKKNKETKKNQRVFFFDLVVYIFLLRFQLDTERKNEY